MTEQIVAQFVNSDGEMQLVTDGPDAECPACGYPERHRIYEASTGNEVVLIADGCPSCETSRMPANVEIEGQER